MHLGKTKGRTAISYRSKRREEVGGTPEEDGRDIDTFDALVKEELGPSL